MLNKDMINTTRLLLRRFKPDDWVDLYAYLSDEKVVQYERCDPYDQEKAKREASRRVGDNAFWAVCLSDGKLIGNLYFKKQEPEEIRTWELGYMLNRQYWNKGYATEACKAIIEYGFGQLGARKITAMCNPENIPSWKLLERLGFIREGHLRKNMYFKFDENNNPIWIDTYIYGLF